MSNLFHQSKASIRHSQKLEAQEEKTISKGNFMNQNNAWHFMVFEKPLQELDLVSCMTAGAVGVGYLFNKLGVETWF